MKAVSYFLIAVLVISLAAAADDNAQQTFNDNPTAENFGALGEPSMDDFNKMPDSEKNNLIKDNPSKAQPFVNEIAGMDVDFSGSANFALENGELINPPGQSFVKESGAGKAAALEGGGFRYEFASSTVDIVGTENTQVSFDGDNLNLGDSKIDLTSASSVKLDANGIVLADIGKNTVRFAEGSKLTISDRDMSLGKDVRVDIQRNSEWANLRSFSKTDVRFSDNGDYGFKGNFFYSGKNDVGRFTYPSVIEAKAREQEQRLGLDIMGKDKKEISLCVGNCDRLFLSSNSLTVSDDNLRMKGYGSLNVFGQDETFSLAGVDEKADFGVSRDSDKKLKIDQYNVPKIGDRDAMYDIANSKIDKEIQSVKGKLANFKQQRRLASSSQDRRELDIIIRESERMIDRYEDMKGDKTKGISYGVVSYTKGDNIVAGTIGSHAYQGISLTDFYPSTAELNMISYGNSGPTTGEKFFTIQTHGDSSGNFDMTTIAYDDHINVNQVWYEGGVFGSSRKSTSGNENYFTTIKIPTKVNSDGTIDMELRMDPSGLWARKTNFGMPDEYKGMRLGEVSIGPSRTTASIDINQIPDKTGSKDMKKAASDTIRDIFSKAALSNPDDMKKAFEGLGLPAQLTESLNTNAPAIVNSVISNDYLKDNIFRVDIAVQKSGSDTVMLNLNFKNKDGKGSTFTTLVNGLDYDAIYNEAKNQITNSDMTSYLKAKSDEVVNELKE